MAYSVTRPGAIEGVKYFLIPNFKNFSWMTVVVALGQMFYSLLIAMGILYTFGSYMKRDIDIEKSTFQVEIFDTAIAIIAGLMVIPAALTSSVALAESVVSTFEDEMKWSRFKASSITTVIVFALGTLSALGFNVLKNVTILKMDILDFFDFLTNSVMMPIAAMATCVLILKVTKIEKIEEEIKRTSKFKRENIYKFVLRYFAIIFLLIILVSSILNAFGVITI